MRRGHGRPPAELKPRPTAKKANARGEGGATTQARDGDGREATTRRQTQGTRRRRSERGLTAARAWEAAGGAEAPPHRQKALTRRGEGGATERRETREATARLPPEDKLRKAAGRDYLILITLIILIRGRRGGRRGHEQPRAELKPRPTSKKH